MALQSSGQISLNDVNVELDNSGTAQIGMGDTAVRDLFGIASGEIEMADGYGKSSEILPTQTYTADSDNYADVQANNNGTIYTRSLTFSGWTPQSGDLVIAVGWAYAHAGQQPSSNMTTIYHDYGTPWYAPNGYKPAYAISYRICNGTESNTIDVVTGGGHASARSYIGAIGTIGGHSIMSGAVFRYPSAITGVSTRNTTNTFPFHTASGLTRVINNSSVSQPHIVFCDNGQNSVPTAPTNYFSDMTNAFEVNRGSGSSNSTGSTVFRPSNGNESVTWTSYPTINGSTKAGRFSTTLLLSF